MSSVLIIPHVGKIGGAGLYIQQISSMMSNRFDVYFGGRWAHEYAASEHCAVIGAWSNGMMVIPNYQGVTLLAKLYYLLRAFIFFPFTFVSSRKNLDNYDVVVLTSGIQLLLLPLIKFSYPKIRLGILIQENWQLENRFWGWISRKALAKAHFIISITQSWANYASTHDLKCLVLKNMYSEDVVDSSSDDLIDKEFDVVYVGGDQKIKGFDILMEVFLRVSKSERVVIGVLGEVSASNRKAVQDINAMACNGSEIICFGFQRFPLPFYRAAKFVFLPIGAPHFCRPAIEAGLLNKSFLISAFSGMEDFVFCESNCLCASIDDLDQFGYQFLRLLKDDELRERLGAENRLCSQKYILNTVDVSRLNAVLLGL